MVTQGRHDSLLLRLSPGTSRRPRIATKIAYIVDTLVFHWLASVTPAEGGSQHMHFRYPLEQVRADDVFHSTSPHSDCIRGRVSQTVVSLLLVYDGRKA